MRHGVAEGSPTKRGQRWVDWRDEQARIWDAAVFSAICCEHSADVDAIELRERGTRHEAERHDQDQTEGG
jgi:hypothetical protein